MSIRDIEKTAYGMFLMSLMRVCGKDAAKCFDARLRFNRKLNLKHPETLADKVVWLENRNASPLISKCTDKLGVRTYVRHKMGGTDVFVPVYDENGWTTADTIPFDKLPNSFALKATHGCKMNYICKDKNAADIPAIKKLANQWLHTTYGTYSGEWHYLDIPHRVYCEQYLGDADKMIDYKFYCLNGTPTFVLVCSNRKAESRGMKVILDLFDMQWNPIPALKPSGLGVPGDGKITRPPEFDRMKEIASILSKDFPFVRVDLYDIHGKVYFGELTFTPSNGVFNHYTDDFLLSMGQRLNI